MTETLNNTDHERPVVDLDRLPRDFPTHRHDAACWEGLGRAVATFGFLEEILGKAIFALTGKRLRRMPFDSEPLA